MLKTLYIRNFLLIDELTISFDKGLLVITGETGAGKSIILGALSLVLGQRSDSKSLRDASAKCIIEAEFDLSAYQLKDFFTANELDYDATSCLLRRELSPSGKSRAFINDSPVSLSVLKELGSYLIDIHSQHQNLLLAESRFQLSVVDAMAQNAALLVAYKNKYAAYLSLKTELTVLEEKAKQAALDEDYIRFQYEQLHEAELKENEEAALEAELETLSHAEEIKATLYKVNELLDSDGQGVLSYLHEARTSFSAIKSYFVQAKEFADRLDTAYLDLKDLSADTNRLAEDVEFNPSRMEWIQNRLNSLYSLQQKHRVATTRELIKLMDEFKSKLSEIESHDDTLQSLKKQVKDAYAEVKDTANELSKKRHSITKQIVGYIAEKLTLLGMPYARLDIQFAKRDEPGEDGIDEVEFLFSANKNEQVKPVSQVASGGELSRLMICLKAMVAGFTALPSIIFDEIDTGVSGDIADKMGELMNDMGRNMQVVAITHLPQIAAKGRSHWFVYKEDSTERTYTRIRLLSEEERVNELARMLSGAELTEEALANARVLLESNHKN